MKRWHGLEKVFKKATENQFKPLKRRTKTITTYWDLYKKSGIFKDIGKYIRAKYKIPHLDSITDHVFYQRDIGNNNVELDDFAWLRESGFEKQIHEEIDYFLKALSLPINAENSLMYWILYNEDLGLYPTYGIIDLIYDITLGTHYADENTGYTKREVTYLIQEAKELVTNMKWVTTEADKMRFLNRFTEQIKKYKRSIRPLRSVNATAKMILMYKKKTSQDIAQSIAGEVDLSLKLANKKAASIRKQIERLYKKLPILKTLLITNK